MNRFANAGPKPDTITGADAEIAVIAAKILSRKFTDRENLAIRIARLVTAANAVVHSAEWSRSDGDAYCEVEPELIASLKAASAGGVA